MFYKSSSRIQSSELYVDFAEISLDAGPGTAFN